MNRYQLAKLVSWAGELETRKRLQKVVYILQAAGCPLGADFYLHHYGPYSEDVARLTDEMVRQKLLSESTDPVGSGKKYSYSLPENVAQEMEELKTTAQGQSWDAELQPFEGRATELLKAPLAQLEYASTILYFQQQGSDWDEAVEKAEKFKGTSMVRLALPMAQQAVS